METVSAGGLSPGSSLPPAHLTPVVTDCLVWLLPAVFPSVCQVGNAKRFFSVLVKYSPFFFLAPDYSLNFEAIFCRLCVSVKVTCFVSTCLHPVCTSPVTCVPLNLTACFQFAQSSQIT